MSFTYKGLSANLDRHIVTTEEIDRYMQRLVEQNPLCPLADYAQDYAAAVGLHRSALAGQPAACAALAAAYRSGALGVLHLPVSEQKARWFEQRALAADSLPE